MPSPLNVLGGGAAVALAALTIQVVQVARHEFVELSGGVSVGGVFHTPGGKGLNRRGVHLDGGCCECGMDQKVTVSFTVAAGHDGHDHTGATRRRPDSRK